MQVRELRAKSTAAAAASAKAQQQSDAAHTELLKLQTQLSVLQPQANRTTALEAELAELKLQLRSAQTLAAQQQQEAMLNRGGLWGGSDGGDAGTESNGVASPRPLSPRPSFSVRQGGPGSRRASGASPLNPRLSTSGMQVQPLTTTAHFASAAHCQHTVWCMHYQAIVTCPQDNPTSNCSVVLHCTCNLYSWLGFSALLRALYNISASAQQASNMCLLLPACLFEFASLRSCVMHVTMLRCNVQTYAPHIVYYIICYIPGVTMSVAMSSVVALSMPAWVPCRPMTPSTCWQQR